MRIADLRIVLTGATGGIGRVAALELSLQGAQILAVGRDQSSLQALLDELTPHPRTPHQYFCADITDTEQRDQLVRQLQGLNSAPNALINMAGYGQFVLFQEQTPDAITQTINLNVTATILLTQALLPLFQQQEEAMIVNVGSILGSLGYPGQSVYCASKFALRGFSEALQRELADTHIRVKYLAPRATATDFNSQQSDALNRKLGNAIDRPEQVAKALVKLMAGPRYRHYVGLPEKVFVSLNHLLPKVVNQALKKQLPIIKSHALSPHPGGPSK